MSDETYLDYLQEFTCLEAEKNIGKELQPVISKKRTKGAGQKIIQYTFFKIGGKNCLSTKTFILIGKKVGSAKKKKNFELIHLFILYVTGISRNA